MSFRISTLFVFLIALSLLVSCASVSKRMPQELSRMHEFLTQDDPGKCPNYHYNFERQAPRLYNEQQQDSILLVIDYLKTECGPAANLDITQTLILADRGQYGDSLVGSATVPQMLWYRSSEERLLKYNTWNYLYGWSQPTDNTHDVFNRFLKKLAGDVSRKTDISPTEHTLGIFYNGDFDPAFERIQRDDMRGTALRKSYDDFVAQTKSKFPARGNWAITMGSWGPRGNAKLLGKHPEIGIMLGGEKRWWRIDGILAYRFLSAKNEYLVDSLGQLVSTDRFTSWLIGVEAGIKFIDNSVFSLDLFGGLGYDVIYSVEEETDEEEYVTHGSWAASIGLRPRVFLDQRSGLYIGGFVRYSAVDYGNPHGTDLSGNTLTVGVMTGWSAHATLKQFLGKLNYKGSWRP